MTDQEEDTQNTQSRASTMYRVQGTMRDAYYGDEDMPRKSNLVINYLNIKIILVNRKVY